jgi:serine/threonine protein kinase
LKPNNIGFIGNTVQLFDFGLSRELPSLDTTAPFAMSGKVGTLRYMAPEVARHEHYNLSADIYSFGMVSYELLSLEKPFDGWTRDMHADLVCQRGVRPDTANTMHPIPAEMKLILEQAWNGNPSCRKTMSYIGAQVQCLESEQIKYLAELQWAKGLHQQLFQTQQKQVSTMVIPSLVPTHGPPVTCMEPSYSVAPMYPMKSATMTLDDSMSTIDTQSLSTGSESFFSG